MSILSSSHICSCAATRNSLLRQRNYIFTCGMWQPLHLNAAVSACHMHVFCLAALHSNTPRQMLVTPPALFRLMNRRQVPEGKHVRCHMPSFSMAAFSYAPRAVVDRRMLIRVLTYADASVMSLIP